LAATKSWLDVRASFAGSCHRLNDGDGDDDDDDGDDGDDDDH
jgi:hypothetical protein